MGGAWLGTHLWEHYAFSGDEKFLKEKAWPLMKGASQFLLSWLIDGPGGYLVTNPSTSPENVFKLDGKEHQLTVASTMDMAIARQLFEDCRGAARVLGISDEFTNRVDSAVQRLYPYHIGSRGQLQEWYKDWDDPNDHHRHISHLFGLHPGNQISPVRTPELATAARQSLLERGDASTGWSMAWKINCWARLGDGNHAYKILKEGLTYIDPRKEGNGAGGTYPNLFDAHPPFQIDGNFGATAGITEMLLQSHDGEISLLPALPDEWAAGKVTGLRARGAFVVDVTWENGKLKESIVHSIAGGNCRIRTKEKVRVVEATTKLVDGENPNLMQAVPAPPQFSATTNPGLPDSPGGHVFDFETVKGKRYTIVPL